jgi:hypothetical protein
MSRQVPLAAYDTDLRARLARLPGPSRSAFAVACAERQYPAADAWLRSRGRPGAAAVRAALDLAWDVVRSEGAAPGDAAAAIASCRDLLPDAMSEATLPPDVDDAIAAAAYALEAAAGLDERSAGWAAQRGTDTLDSVLLATVIDPDEPDADERVWAHRLVVAEVERREADLRRLTAATDWPAVIDLLRADAERSPVIPTDALRA